MYVRGVRVRDFNHLQWQKLNIEQYITEVRLPRFRPKSSRFIKLVQYESYLTTVVEALNTQVSRLLVSTIAIEPTTLLPLERQKITRP